LRAELGAGESEVITLAMELNASKVLIDERKARRIAKLIYNLSITGTGGLLLRAKQSDLIKEIRPLLERMKANGYYISDRLVSRIAKEAGE
jgi:predicted nucleic acid-binding protein